jgi:hypothetical protein
LRALIAACAAAALGWSLISSRMQINKKRNVLV